MKKVVWGGFCMIASILLFWMFSTITITSSNLPELALKILSVGFGIYGLVVGLQGLRKD